jgi:hypothetical protein
MRRGMEHQRAVSRTADAASGMPCQCHVMARSLAPSIFPFARVPHLIRCFACCICIIARCIRLTACRIRIMARCIRLTACRIRIMARCIRLVAFCIRHSRIRIHRRSAWRQLPWREACAAVVVVPEDADGRVDVQACAACMRRRGDACMRLRACVSVCVVHLCDVCA